MEITGQEEKRIYWIDFAKLLAIIAVLIDHTNGILYEDSNIAWGSYFSVSLFVILMGITTNWSLNKYKSNIPKMVGKKCWGIIRPYLVATFVYYIFMFKSFDLEKYINYVIHFNISGPFYYILLYVQLLLISPIIYSLLNASEGGMGKKILFWGGVIAIASLSTNYTNILSVYGSGKLFGGTYLMLFCIGMCFAKYIGRIWMDKVPAVMCFMVGLILTITWCRLVQINRGQIDAFFPFGRGINPPSVSFCIYAILIAFTLFCFEVLLTAYNFSRIKRVFGGIAFWGKYTLHIFLWHCFFLEIVFPFAKNQTGILIGNMWLKRIVYMLVMILGSILIGSIFDKMHYFFVSAYQKTGDAKK